MATPVRLQLSRKRGFNLQALSLATNGLPAVVVSRQSKTWGNPYVIGPKMTRAGSLERYRKHVERHPELIERAQKELRGKNLACFCRRNEACHADFLLELAANPLRCEAAGS